MNPAEAEKQIAQMVEFIKQEAREKADEIRYKTEQEFNIQKLEFIENAKLQIKEEYKQKQLDAQTQIRIERSSLVNSARLAKVKRRNEVVEKVREAAREKLATADKHPKYPELLKALIVQGLIRLKETEVTVRIRQEDEAVVSGILHAAESDYKRVMKRDTTLDVDVKLKIDTSEYLPAGPTKSHGGYTCAGGVVLICSKGRIVLDNTLDRRLDLAFQELKPIVRKTIFG
eukprot:TRINITY_DN7330_c0_g1_i2.p1 TRINITY_DN7330_c0_g1~~TRINITY_DN7330_c0_g1_i2.p1  ORF type:complete len:260 (-),score=90.00 TRINITY_DN7330_c0_g1_i2:72-761(-)